MSKKSTVEKSKKPKRRRSTASLVASPAVARAEREWSKRCEKGDASKLEEARAAFDAAQLQAVKACLGFTLMPCTTISPRAIAAQEAGFALQDAGAALLRARAENAPLPIALTPKAERARLKSKAPVGFDDSGPLRGRSFDLGNRDGLMRRGSK
jgi:hypothetical protein